MADLAQNEGGMKDGMKDGESDALGTTIRPILQVPTYIGTYLAAVVDCGSGSPVVLRTKYMYVIAALPKSLREYKVQ